MMLNSKEFVRELQLRHESAWINPDTTTASAALAACSPCAEMSHIDPPSNSAYAFDIESPRPVPLYFFELGPSTW